MAVKQVVMWLCQLQQAAAVLYYLVGSNDETEALAPTLIAEVRVRRRGPRLVGVPLVTGEAWPEPLLKCVRRV